MDARTSRYHDVYARSMRDPEGFWGEAAQAIDWYEPPKKIFDKDAGIYGRWFTGGVTNTCYNAIDRHVERGRGGQVALIHDSPVTKTITKLTYGQLLDEVKAFAAVLQDFGVAAKELATRIDDAKPKLILSASCGIEVNRIVPYKPLLDHAIELAQHKPE